jgi:hypothetical protein
LSTKKGKPIIYSPCANCTHWRDFIVDRLDGILIEFPNGYIYDRKARIQAILGRNYDNGAIPNP